MSEDMMIFDDFYCTRCGKYMTKRLWKRTPRSFGEYDFMSGTRDEMENVVTLRCSAHPVLHHMHEKRFLYRKKDGVMTFRLL